MPPFHINSMTRFFIEFFELFELLERNADVLRWLWNCTHTCTCLFSCLSDVISCSHLSQVIWSTFYGRYYIFSSLKFRFRLIERITSFLFASDVEASILNCSVARSLLRRSISAYFIVIQYRFAKQPIYPYLLWHNCILALNKCSIALSMS